MRFFWKKQKIASALRAPPSNTRLPPAAGDPPPDPNVVTPAYYYNFIELVSNAKMRFITPTPLKKNKITTVKNLAFASSVICTYFSLQSV